MFSVLKFTVVSFLIIWMFEKCPKNCYYLIKYNDIEITEVMVRIFFLFIFIFFGVDVKKDDYIFGFRMKTMMDRLHFAASIGNVSEVKNLLKKYDANFIGKNLWRGYPPIFAAIYGGHLESVQILLDHGADVNWQFRKGTTPLHYAIRLYSCSNLRKYGLIFNLLINCKNIQLDRFAKSRGVHPSIHPHSMRYISFLRGRGKFSGTPLALAARLNCQIMVMKLIQHGAQPKWVIMNWKYYTYMKGSWKIFLMLFLNGCKDYTPNLNLLKCHDSLSSQTEFKQLKKWFNQIKDNPLKLKQHCRASIYQSIGSNDCSKSIKNLGLPHDLVRYMRFHDISKDM